MESIRRFKAFDSRPGPASFSVLGNNANTFISLRWVQACKGKYAAGGATEQLSAPCVSRSGQRTSGGKPGYLLCFVGLGGNCRFSSYFACYEKGRPFTLAEDQSAASPSPQTCTLSSPHTPTVCQPTPSLHGRSSHSLPGHPPSHR